MIVKKRKIKLKERKEYKGKIVRVNVNDTQEWLWIIVELNHMKGTTFLKSVPYNEYANSDMMEILERFDLFASSSEAELDDLEGVDVIVTMKQNGNRWFVNEIEPQETDFSEYYDGEDDLGAVFDNEEDINDDDLEFDEDYEEE